MSVDYPAVKKQIEFYFSNSNFRKDTFLREAAASDAEGFVPISTLLTFNKLKSLTTDADEIVKAVADSESVVVSDDKLKIRRAAPLPEVDNSKECTLYVKGYPTSDPDVTIESITEQFSPYGKVCMVRLRKDNSKAFKGSCFIEFEKSESVDAAIEAAHKDGVVTLSYKDTPFLCVMKLGEWLERKSNKSKGKKADTSATDNEDNAAGKRKREDNDDGDESKNESKGVEFTPGQIIKVTGVPSTSSLYDLKDVFKVLGDVKYVDYTSGAEDAFVRMGSAEAAETVLKALAAGEVKVGDESVVLSGSLMEGEEETSYWEKIGQNSGRSSSGGRGRGRGGRGRGRGGKRTRR
mmetsp:Transcript_25510/g.37649  ORF Transcript_25510/g.37649 Transcript_25510/m.37649 type:complete len:350 (+) Transcript_25510:83-1132(+)